MNNFTQSFFTFCRNSFKKSLSLAVLLTLLVGGLSYGQINITAGGIPVSQNFNGLGATSTAALPTDWTVQKTAVERTIPSFSSTATNVELAGGNSMSNTAANGIYRFNANGSTTESAIGGLSSGTASKTVALYVRLRNNAVSDINSFTISYNVEKFRNGSNASGFSVELYYSTNGTSWTSCGTDFLTSFTADADSNGFVTSPGTSTSIFSKTFTPSAVISQNSVVYFAWRYSVTSGTATTNAQALGVDDVSIFANGAPSAITSAQTGNWSSISTWVGGVVPTSAANVIIATGHVVTLDATTNGIDIRNAGTTTTVNSGGTLATNIAYTNSGTTTINGTFQINQNGFGGGAGNWIYGASSNLIFNHTSGGYGPIDTNHTYWPISGPTNVTVANSGAGGINLGVSRTISGVFQTAGNIQGTALTLNGTIKINTGGSFATSPIYGNASTLIYNTGATFGRGNEWTTATSGAGYPANVQISNPGTVTTLDMGTTSAQCSGSITVDTSTILNTTSAGLLAIGSVTVNGTISLGGDVTTQGNWTIGGSGAQNNNGKAVFFTAASGNQTITKTVGGTVFFDYLVINKAAGNVVLSASPATSVTINTATGDVLQLSNAGVLDLNGQTLTLNNNGGNIAANTNGRSITSGVTGATLAITGTKSFSGAGTLVINTNVTTVLSSGFDFGSSKVTINGILQLNLGGFAPNGSAPIYASGSTLLFNTGGNYDLHNGALDVAGWFRNVASTGTAEAGVPWNVTISNNTSVRYNMLNTDIFPRYINGNLIINTGSSFTLGGLTGTAGDFFLRGNWTNSGTFIPNTRLVNFNGTTAQTLTGATTFDFLTLSNGTGLTIANAVTVNQTLALTSGKITIGANNLTVAGTITGQSATNYVVTNSTGQLKQTVGTSAIIFPVGNTAYNPITFTNSGTSDSYGVRVVDAAPTAAINTTKTVLRQWITTEAVAGGSNLAVVAQYNPLEIGSNFASSTTNYIGFYNGTSWIQAQATSAGTNPITVSSNSNIVSPNLTSGTQYFAIGKDNAFLSVATKFVITSITPASPGAGYGFTVTVQAQDDFGATPNVIGNTSFTLSTNGNAGAIGGTTTGTILAGSNSVVVSGVILPTAGTGVTLTATRTSGDNLIAGTSSSFNVLAAASQLAFGVAPPATGFVGVNLTSFTVEARRPDASLDTFYTGNITIAKFSGTGNLTGTLTVAAVAGVATFSSAQFDAASTYTLIATSGSLTSVTSGNIVVTLAPVTLYLHNFNTAATASPYTVLPTATTGTPLGVLNPLFTNSTSWTSSTGSFFNFSGNSGQALVIQPGLGVTSSMTLTLNVVDGYEANLSSFNFWRQKSSTGPNISSMTINGNQVLGASVSPTTGSFLGTTAISNSNNLTGTITVTINLTAPTGASQNLRLDEFTLSGNINCIQPTAYAVTGGGTSCASTGVTVGLANSQIGISYHLKNGATTVGAAVPGTGSAISFGAQTTAGTYTAEATNTNGTCNLTTIMTGSAVVILDSTSFAGTVSANQAICSGSQPADITLSGNTGTIQWQSSTNNSTFTNINGQTSATLFGTTIGALTATTYYRAIVTSGSCPAATSATVTITVSPTSFAGTVSGNQTICFGSQPADITLSGSVGAIQWQSSTNNTTFTDISGQTAATLSGTTIGVITATTYYRAIITSGTCPAATSATVTITDNPTSVAGTVSANQAICSGSQPADITLSGNTGTIQWQSSTNNSTFNNISGQTSATLSGTTIGALTATTYYRAIVTSGSCPAATSTTVTITVSPTSVAGTVSADQAFCSGTQPTDITLAGSTGAIQWQSSTNNTTFTDISGQTSATLSGTTIGPLTVTTYYRAVVTSGSCPAATSPTVTITVSPTSVAGTVSANQAICFGSQPSDITLSGSTGAVQWQTSSDNSTFVNIGGQTSATLSGATIGAITATTYYRAIVTSGSCAAATSATVTVLIETTNWTSALGGSWDNGTPTSAKSAVISFNYAVPANLSACTLTVNNNAVVTIPSGFNVTLNGQLNVISGSSFTLSNNANLIQSTDVANAGNIIVKRNSSALKRQDYTLWSSPVAGQNLLNFSPLTLTNRFYTYETNATPTPNVYVAVPSPSSTSFAAGKGYLIRMPNNHPTFATVYTGTFTGIPNNGPVPATLTNAGAGLRFNAVGNPYPSTIDMASFVAANRQTGDERITGTLYFWRKTNNVLTTPGYCTWTAGTFVSNGEAQVFNPNGIIQVGQGFIVEAQGTATQLNFNNTMRVANNNNQFFKSSAAAAVVPTETNRIWLNMTSPVGEFSQTAVGYMTNATQGVDAYDGKFFNEGQIAISSYLEATDYAIQGRALPFEPSDVVPLNVKVTTAGSYSIAIDHVDGLFATGTQDILLKDNLNGTYTNLNSGSYTFTTAAGTFNNRFELVYQTALSNVNPILSESNVIVYKQNSNFVINTGIATMASVKAYDMRGRLLMEKNNINASETQLNLGTTNQVVLLQITSTDGLVVTKKVVN